MQKKAVGIIMGVAAAHAVLLISLMAGGGCRSTTVLGPHTYNNGPEFNEVPPAGVNVPPTPRDVPPVVEGGSVVPPAPVVLPPAPVVQPPPQVTPPAAASTTTYTVKKGDTLSLIAYKHGVSVKALAACNNLSGKDMDRIRVGQVLNIPEGGVYNPDRQPPKRRAPRTAPAANNNSSSSSAAAAPSAELPADGVYVVKAGDTLERIGRRFGVSAQAIARENNISLNKVLHIGDKLRIPAKGSSTSATPAAAAPAAATPSSTAPSTSTIDTLDDLDPELDSDAPAAAATTAPAANTSSTLTDSLEIPSDTTVEEYCKQINISVEELRRYNPDLPADGKLKTGSYVVVPRLQLQ